MKSAVKAAKPFNVWVAEVVMGGRKSCPNCHVKLDQGNSIISIGEYLRGKYHNVCYGCRDCYKDVIDSRLYETRKPYQLQVRSGCRVRWLTRSENGYGPSLQG